MTERIVLPLATLRASQQASCLSISVQLLVCAETILITLFLTSVLQVIIIVLLATTPRHEMHSASYVFGSEGIINQTGGWNDGLAFLFGLLSVQWTVSSHQKTRSVNR